MVNYLKDLQIPTTLTTLMLKNTGVEIKLAACKRKKITRNKIYEVLMTQKKRSPFLK
jgi:hypothetical protein